MIQALYQWDQGQGNEGGYNQCGRRIGQSGFDIIVQCQQYCRYDGDTTQRIGQDMGVGGTHIHIRTYYFRRAWGCGCSRIRCGIRTGMIVMLFCTTV